ncbi:MAG: hypothetical protein MR601_01065 [Erysipelotrichaceae bacterium]|nr:hypothetical protein [Erysipelotrichaceae bacterium]
MKILENKYVKLVDIDIKKSIKNKNKIVCINILGKLSAKKYKVDAMKKNIIATEQIKKNIIFVSDKTDFILLNILCILLKSFGKKYKHKNRIKINTIIKIRIRNSNVNINFFLFNFGFNLFFPIMYKNSKKNIHTTMHNAVHV